MASRNASAWGHAERSRSRPAKLVRVALVVGERAKVRRILDDLQSIVGAAVLGDDVLAVGDPHALLRRDQGERLAHEAVGDRIVVEVEADVRGLARRRRAHQLALEGVLRQREQARPLLGERLGDQASVGVAGDAAGVGDSLDPGGELRVEIVDRAERAGVEERVAQVADRSLDLSLLVAPVRSAWAWWRSGSDPRARAGEDGSG